FEARKPKGMATITAIDGKVHFRNEEKKGQEIDIVSDASQGEAEVKTYPITYGSHIIVQEDQQVKAGDPLTAGSINPHDLLDVKGVDAVQDYILKEVQSVYRRQGVDISDKHIEVIVRQMMKKVRVTASGESKFLPGAQVDFLDFEDENERLAKEGKELAEGERVLLGITKAALATDSFLSAASFQETTKVLTDAAIKGKVDHLQGLKENVIIGKLIPAGTGMKRYRDIKLNTDYTTRIEDLVKDEPIVAEDEKEDADDKVEI
ncbi:MAG: DNA-directed RNA polymerase subunit beta', partial [Lachnospiraceae bacterium]|nr:DNA-directed RNA polymerase subunit beta' [Lachnospiraceae bacterium]